MALLGTITQGVFQSIQYRVDYDRFLSRGESLTSVIITVDAGTATISHYYLSPDQKAVFFNLNNGTFGDQFNVILFATTTVPQQRYDQIGVLINSNGGPVLLSQNQQLMLSIIGPTGPAGAAGPTGPAGGGGTGGGGSGGTG